MMQTMQHVSGVMQCTLALQDEALDLINLECGAAYELTTPWQELFLEDSGVPATAAAAGSGPDSVAAAAAAAGGGRAGGVLGADWPSDDEEDSDFQ